MSKTEKLGFWSIVLLTINSIIGTGIFLSPGSVVKQVGTYAPLAYLCAAGFAVVLALSFASASRYVVKSGAAYAYVEAAFGENAGLYVGITRFVSASIAGGVMATGVVKTVLQIMGLDTSRFSLVTVGFLLLMFLLFIINVFGLKVLEWVSNLSTLGKILALALTIVAGLFLLSGQNGAADLSMLLPGKEGGAVPNITSKSFVTAVIAAFYAFTGFEGVASGSSDMEKPEKNLPRALPLSIFLIAAVYLGIIFVSMRLNPLALLESEKVVVLADVFKNPLLQQVIVLGAFVSMFGINIAASFHTPRLLEAMARDGQVQAVFAKRTKGGFPFAAFLFSIVFAIMIPMAFHYDMKGIMIISSIARFVQFLLVPLAVICFYYGKQKGELIQNPIRNFLLDVPLSVLALLLTIFLLTQFNWIGQFSVTVKDTVELNYYAIFAMLFGYVLFPILAFFMRGRKSSL